jgi:hypothetical protein
MADLNGQPGEVRMTIEVKRAATGEVETFELIGTLQADETEAPVMKGYSPSL